MEIFEAIETLRAMRHLKRDPVPPELVRRCLEAAIRAPSGGNRQPWRFLVITDPELKRQIGEWYQDGARQLFSTGYGMERDANGQVPAASLRMMKSANYLAEHMGDAPVLILACVEIQGRPSLLSGASIYPAIQNLMLAARALGLGTTLTTLHHRHEAEIKAVLGIPEEVATAALIPLGYPEGHFGSGPRQPLEQVAFTNHWGKPLGDAN